MKDQGRREREINCPPPQCAGSVSSGIQTQVSLLLALLITIHHRFIHSCNRYYWGTTMCRARAEVPVLPPWGLRCPRGQTLYLGRSSVPGEALPPALTELLGARHRTRPYRTARKQKGCVGVSDLRCLPESQMALVSAPQHSGAGSGVGAGAGMASDKALKTVAPKIFRSVTQTKLKVGKHESKNAFISPSPERLSLTPRSCRKPRKRRRLDTERAGASSAR